MRTAYASAILAATLLAAPASAGPTFVLTDAGGAGAGTAARAAFESAALRWATAFSDDVTIRLDVSFKTLPKGTLGTTYSGAAAKTYTDVRMALGADASSDADRSAVASLGKTLSFMSNEAGNCTTQVGCQPILSTSRTLDADNTFDNNYLSVSSSLQKALGLAPASLSRDASISFNSIYKWDWDPANGIASGNYDFIGIATHEIGHALGFMSGVDRADSWANQGFSGLDGTYWGTVLDLYRYQGGERDWTTGGTPCLSATGGASCIGLLSTGVRTGDKKQASHWKDNKKLGILDPTAAAAEKLKISANDLVAFDIIGWNVAGAGDALGTVVWSETPSAAPADDWVGEALPAPSPGPLCLLGLGTVALLRLRKRAAG